MNHAYLVYQIQVAYHVWQLCIFINLVAMNVKNLVMNVIQKHLALVVSIKPIFWMVINAYLEIILYNKIVKKVLNC